MKGILANLSVVAALISNHNIPVKSSIFINSKLAITKFAEDKDGSLRNAIGILLNLAFDNAKDPKIEALGLNEITANMFIALMLSDPKIDTVTDKKSFILEKVENISDYFNSPMLKEFIDLKREMNGSLFNINEKMIFKNLSVRVKVLMGSPRLN